MILSKNDLHDPRNIVHLCPPMLLFPFAFILCFILILGVMNYIILLDIRRHSPLKEEMIRDTNNSLFALFCSMYKTPVFILCVFLLNEYASNSPIDSVYYLAWFPDSLTILVLFRGPVPVKFVLNLSIKLVYTCGGYNKLGFAVCSFP